MKISANINKSDVFWLLLIALFEFKFFYINYLFVAIKFKLCTQSEMVFNKLVSTIKEIIKINLITNYVNHFVFIN